MSQSGAAIHKGKDVHVQFDGIDAEPHDRPFVAGIFSKAAFRALYNLSVRNFFSSP